MYTSHIMEILLITQHTPYLPPPSTSQPGSPGLFGVPSVDTELSSYSSKVVTPPRGRLGERRHLPQPRPPHFFFRLVKPFHRHMQGGEIPPKFPSLPQCRKAIMSQGEGASSERASVPSYKWQCTRCSGEIPGVVSGFRFNVCPFCGQEFGKDQPCIGEHIAIAS